MREPRLYYILWKNQPPKGEESGDVPAIVPEKLIFGNLAVGAKPYRIILILFSPVD
jgi:hypothetical protein